MCNNDYLNSCNNDYSLFVEQGWDVWRLFHPAKVAGCWTRTDPVEVCSTAHELSAGDREVCICVCVCVCVWLCRLLDEDRSCGSV